MTQQERNLTDRTALAHDLLRIASQRYQGQIALASSLGPQSLVLVDLIAQNNLDIQVLLIDTGLLFEETYRLRRQVEAHYGLRIHAVSPQDDIYGQRVSHGPSLWQSAPDQCCEIRKVQPMQRALAGLKAWVTGIRREQTQARNEAQIEEWDARFGLTKLNPLLEWGADDVHAYLRAHRVPYNPLLDLGYPSIGCAPCTAKPAAPLVHLGGERAGRWPAHPKTECGLHQRAAAQGGAQ